jgi:hypothetical protein
MLEAHAQNVLYHFIHDGTVVVAYRDLSDVHKDISIRLERSLPTELTGHNCLYPGDADIYQRRSLQFDFRLCGYLLLPMISALSRLGYGSPEKLRARVRAETGRLVEKGRGCYFPPGGQWYSYPAIAEPPRFSYIAHVGPPLR